jgi:hypothetical protein
LISSIDIHIGDGSFTEAVEKDCRAPEAASPKESFLYVGEFLQDFFPRSSFESFCNISWSFCSCVDGDMDMVLIESDFSEDPSMLFTDLSKNLFATFLQLRKVKYVVTVFGFEAQVQYISSDA